MKKVVTYVFIDSQNLNLGIRNDILRNGKLIYKGWKLDFEKFFRYLKDKYRADKAFLFIGYIPEKIGLYNRLKSYGYELIFKPMVKDEHGKPKGNVDAELVLYSAAIEYDNYDLGVFVAGDGDYRCLYEYLETKKKLYRIIIPNEKAESSLLKPFQKYKSFLVFDRSKLEYNIKNGGRRS